MSESAAKFLPHVRLLLHYVVMKSDVGQKIILDVSHVFGPKYYPIGHFVCQWT